MQEQNIRINDIDIFSFGNPNQNGFCLALYIKAGCIYETREENGITHLFEHVVFRNLKQKYGNQFYDKLAENGLYFNATTYREFLVFALEGPLFGFNFATEILCAIFDEINVTGKQLKFEKDRIKAENREESNRTTTKYKFHQKVWQNTNNDNTIIGYCKNIDSISIHKLDNFRKSILSKDNFFICVTGGISDDNLNYLKNMISHITISTNTINRGNLITNTDLFFNRPFEIHHRDGSDYAVYIGFDVDTQRYSGGVHDILYNILFKGENCLIDQNLSEDDPLIYSFDSTYEQYKNIGSINFNYEVKQTDLLDSIERVVYTLNCLKNGNFNFRASQRLEIADYLTLFDNPSDLNWSIAYYSHILGCKGYDYFNVEPQGLTNITKEQIMKAASEIFKLCNLTILIKGKKNKINFDALKSVLSDLK